MIKLDVWSYAMFESCFIFFQWSCKINGNAFVHSLEIERVKKQKKFTFVFFWSLEYLWCGTGQLQDMPLYIRCVQQVHWFSHTE